MGIHCSPIGIIPKKNKLGKWRLIVDLSSPEGASVNDGVDKEISSLSYTSVDAIAEWIITVSHRSNTKPNLPRAEQINKRADTVTGHDRSSKRHEGCG